MRYLVFFLIALSFDWISCSLSINSLSSKLAKHAYRENNAACFQKATCQPLQNATCFGTSLPYALTSIDLAEDSGSHFEIQDNLALWQGLQSVPRCWAVIQPLLCAVYMPKCENGSVFLPTQEMCSYTRGPCKIVEREDGWPSFLKCENKTLFPPHCRNPLQEIKFNTSYKCIAPLVETYNPDSYFYDIEGCGIQCQNPLYSKEDHMTTHSWVCFFASVSLAITLFILITFIISWNSSNRYPDRIIFYISLCWVFVSSGWLLQFVSGKREEIVCAIDGTLRQKQPQSDYPWCITSFILVYYFSMATVVWFVILTYAWYTPFREKSVPKNLEKKRAYFHMCAWCIPLVLTVIVMSSKKVDGDSMSGICFVNIESRIWLVLIPVGMAALSGGTFLILTIYKLFKVKLNIEEVTNEQARKKIRTMILKRSIFAVSVVKLVVITFTCHTYDFIYQSEWNESLKDYVVCLAMHSAQSYLSVVDPSFPRCVLKSKPNVTYLHVHCCCLSIFSVMILSLIWNKATLETWKSFFNRVCAPSGKDGNTLKKHQIIRKAFSKRNEIQQGNFSFTSGPDDPLGLNMDLSSVGSRDISSSWAMALPNLMRRRNALCGIVPFAPRHYSSASEISRHISMDSFNQPNLDSLSMQMSERDFQDQAWRQRRKTRKERERFLRANRIAPWFPGNRRGSDTSLQSSLLAASMAVAASRNANVQVKVTKSTSTGDLALQQSIAETALMSSAVLQPRHRSLIQQAVRNPPPFMHGMIDSCNRLDCRNVPSATGSSMGQRFTPIPMASNLQTPLPGMVRPPILAQSFDMMNNIPHSFIGAGMYPQMNGMYPRYPSINNFSFPAYNLPYLAYAAYQSLDALSNQYQPSLIPLHPRADSASETEYFPIIMSDSEFTDTGFRSYDESQVLNTQRLMQERLQAQLLAKEQLQTAKGQAQGSKPVLESQACAKTQFLEKLKAEGKAAENSQPSSCRKTHSAVPPPSPADSLNNLNSENVNSESINSETMNSESMTSEVIIDNDGSDVINSEVINSESMVSENIKLETNNSDVINSRNFHSEDAIAENLNSQNSNCGNIHPAFLDSVNFNSEAMAENSECQKCVSVSSGILNYAVTSIPENKNPALVQFKNLLPVPQNSKTDIKLQNSETSFNNDDLEMGDDDVFEKSPKKEDKFKDSSGL